MRLSPTIAGACLLLLLTPPTTVEAAHPFYERMLREGSAALERKDYGEAQELLELASFGFLSEPKGLAEGLVQLALAEAEDGQDGAFQATFDRIMEVEERFDAYSQASLDAELKRRFEEIVAARVPERTLLASPAFRPIARRKALDRIGALPKNERRQALQGLLAEDPKSTAPALMLAEMDIQAGDGAGAVAALQGLLAHQPDHGPARCLLGQAHALARRCDLTIPVLEGCADSPRRLALATTLLDCYAATGQWLRADAFFNRLDPSVASDRQMVRMSRRIERGKRQAPKLQGAPGTGQPAEQIAGEAPSSEGEPPPGAVAPPEATPGERTLTEPASREIVPEETTPKETAPEETIPRETGSTPVKVLTFPGPRKPPEDPPAQAQPPAPQRPDLQRPDLQRPDPQPVAPPEEARQQLEEARRQLAKARLASDLESALTLAKDVADRYPEDLSAQHLVAEIAYRASLWQEAAKYFRRGGDPGEERPNLLFFMAVSFYETGDRPAARDALRRSLPSLQKTPFVTSYAAKILDDE